MWMQLGCDQEKQKTRQVFDQWTGRPGEYGAASPSPGSIVLNPMRRPFSKQCALPPGHSEVIIGGVGRPNATKDGGSVISPKE